MKRPLTGTKIGLSYGLAFFFFTVGHFVLMKGFGSVIVCRELRGMFNLPDHIFS